MWTKARLLTFKFLRDFVYQNLFKSVHFWQSHSRNHRVAFFETQCTYKCLGWSFSRQLVQQHENCSGLHFTDPSYTTTGKQNSSASPPRWAPHLQSLWDISHSTLNPPHRHLVDIRPLVQCWALVVNPCRMETYYYDHHSHLVDWPVSGRRVRAPAPSPRRRLAPLDSCRRPRRLAALPRTTPSSCQQPHPPASTASTGIAELTVDNAFPWKHLTRAVK